VVAAQPLGGLSLRCGATVATVAALGFVTLQHAIEAPSGQPFHHDYLAAVDFDGDWVAGNNLDRVMQFDLVSTAYWWETVTPQRRYRGYLYYFLSSHDGSHRRGQAHDLKWLVVALERGAQGPSSDRFLAVLIPGPEGTVIALEREDPPANTAEPFRSGVARSRAARPLSETSVLDVDFVLDDRGLHPVIYGTGGRHLMSTERPDLRGLPNELELQRWTDWRGRGISARTWDIEDPPGPKRVTNTYGLMYRPDGSATVTAPAGRKAVGLLPHHWQEVSYQLRPLDELWQRRNDPQVFAASGSMAGAEAPTHASVPPWLAVVDGKVVAHPLFHQPDEVLAGLLDGITPATPTSFSFASAAEVAAQRAKTEAAPTPSR
jgi:hypothetical protein